jgi:asparagine synthase (glutamine-hydrolysing)
VPSTSTLVAGITALPPGHLGIWEQGDWQTMPYWEPSYAPALPLTYPQLVEHTRSALQQSVQSHLIADVPVGLFLSGGLDSSAVLALAGPGLTTLSIGFEEAAFDESTLAARLADRFGARHEPLILRRQEAWQRLPGFLAALDQPTIDGFNTYCVSALAAQSGLKVVMSGLGGDELFGGYPSFRRLPRWLRWHRRLGAAAPLGARLMRRRGSGSALRLAQLLDGPPHLSAAHRCLRGVFADSEIDRLLRHWGLEPLGVSPSDAPARMDVDANHQRFPTSADAIAWLESSAYMGDMLLRDSDALAMAHGLELRLPLVDAVLFRSLASQPARWRLAAGKQLLRDAMPEVQAVIGDGPKQGFVFPFRSWFAESRFGGNGPDALPPLPSLPAELDLAPWARRWGLMVLGDWLRRHLDLDLGMG